MIFRLQILEENLALYSNKYGTVLASCLLALQGPCALRVLCHCLRQKLNNCTAAHFKSSQRPNEELMAARKA